MAQSNTALVIIDVQTGFIEGEFMVYQAPQLLTNVQTLIAQAREHGTPIIFVRHDEAPEYDGPLHPALGVQADDIVISKLTPDSFHNTNLQETLEAQQIKKLIIAGLQTEMCIDTTCRRAWSMGYELVLVKDAHSTVDFENAPITAAQAIAHYSDVLGYFATVTPLSEIDFATL